MKGVGAQCFCSGTAHGTGCCRSSIRGGRAVAGYDEYWLRVKSPTAALSCVGCSHSSASPLRTATEVVRLSYLVQPPAAVQSNQVGCCEESGGVSGLDRGVG